MKALLINVDFTTGERRGCCRKQMSGPIEKRKLLTHPTWQNVEKGIEIRLVRDGDVDRFRGKDGVTVLEDEDAINAAVRAHMPPGGRRRFRIFSESILAASMHQRGVEFDLTPSADPEELLASLYDDGVQGIQMMPTPEPVTAAQMAAAYP